MLCGQTMMAAADTAMVLAIMTLLGGFKPMTTVQLQTSFLRPIAGDAGAARVTARVLRMGKNLVFGEIEVTDRQGCAGRARDHDLRAAVSAARPLPRRPLVT